MAHNLGSRLKEAVSAGEWQLLQRVAEAAKELRMPLYAVGGLPRDLILSRPIGDFDLVVEGKAEALAKLLAARFGGKVTVHGRFGTAKWDLRETRAAAPEAEQMTSRGNGAERPFEHGHALDLITARSETYKHAAALPTVQRGTIDDDLGRRDFTINALAIRLDAPHAGEVRDDFGGWEDIEAGVVRVLHDRSFVDDPTRMYRAVRYEQRYAFEIAEETLRLVATGLPFVEKLSAQRIRHELDLILDETQAAKMLRRLDSLELLGAIHPALIFDKEAERRVAAASMLPRRDVPPWPLHEVRWACWLMAFSEAEIHALGKRLHFAAAQYKALVAASQLEAESASLLGAAPSRWVERLDKVPSMAVYTVSLASTRTEVREALQQYLAMWRHVKPKTTGHDLKRLGVKPGAEYKRILGELRRALLDGEIRGGEEEQAYLEGLLRKEPNR